jgi:hypothetical protein
VVRGAGLGQLAPGAPPALPERQPSADDTFVELIAAKRADDGEALRRLHPQEAEDYLLLNKSMTTVLDVLG